MYYNEVILQVETRLNTPFVVLVLLITFLSFGFLAFLVNGKQIFQFDNVIISFIHSLESERLTTIMKFFSFIGSGISVKVLALITIIVLFFFFKYRSELILFTVVLIGSHYIFQALKQIFQRPRPELHQLIEISGYSFPKWSCDECHNFIRNHFILTMVSYSHKLGPNSLSHF